jgi:MFS transporter, ACDE family, multidrug resistance protein
VAAPPTTRPPAWLIFSITATAITGHTLITPSLPEIVAGVGAAQAAAGIVVAAATLPGVFLAPVIGVLADRYGRREVLMPCMVLFGVAGGLIALAPSLWVLVALRLLQGAGSAGLINLSVVLIGDHWAGATRAAMIGRNAAVLTMCLSVYPVLGGTLTAVGGWRAPFLVYPVALVTAWLLWRHLPPSPKRDVAVADQLRETLPALRQRSVLGVLGMGGITFALIFGLLLTVLPIHLQDVFGVGPTLRGLILGLPALANTAVALSLGWLQRFRKRHQLAVAAAIFVVSLLSMSVAPTLGLLVAAIVAFGVGEGLMIPNLQDVAAGSSEASRGAVVALFVSGARLGQTVGPVVAGVGLATVGAPAVFAAGAAVSALMLVPLVAAGSRVRAPR